MIGESRQVARGLRAYDWVGEVDPLLELEVKCLGSSVDEIL